ncbi:MAG: co-chaperone GroES [Candidatus Ratteibacteria bacterium]|nr:co-chaperone GroES [Candidatus Ratteibacteria bacterium]
MQVRPLGDKILVKRTEVEEIKKGGIIIPDTAKEKPQQGKIVAVGSGRMEGDKKVPLEVKKGDTILFAKYSGNEISVGDEEYLILKEEDVLAIVEK